MRPARLAGFLAALALAAALPGVLPDFSLHVLDAGMIAAIAVLGLNFTFGWAGLISLAQAGFMGLGAYTAALLTTRAELAPWLAAPLGIAVAAGAAALIAVPLLRLRGHYLALATLGFNMSFQVVATGWKSFLGGSDGVAGIPSPALGGLELDSDFRYFYLVLAALALAVLMAARIRGAPLGRAMIAVRDDELAAATASINVLRVKVQAFVIGAAYAGAAGVLLAHFAHYVEPDDFSLANSIAYLAMLIIGGEGAIAGAVGGAVLVTFLPEWLRFLGAGYLVLFGLAIVAVLILCPKGIAGLIERWTAGRRMRASAG